MSIDHHDPELDRRPPPPVSPIVRRFTGSEPDRDTRSNPALVVALAALVVWGFWSLGWQMMLVVFALVLSVILHELGHYVTAKAAGVKVTEFFLGMGPRIFSFRRGETEYGLKLLPVAAYVRPIGANNLETVDPADEPRTVRAQSFWRRFSIFFGGPAMNLLITVGCIWALVVFSGVPGDGLFKEPTEPANWKITAVVDGSGAAAAGVQPGDRIVGFDGVSIGKFSELRSHIASNEGKTVALDVQRGNQTLHIHATIGPKDGAPSTGFLGVQGEGIFPPLAKSNPIAAIPKSFAELVTGSVETMKVIGAKFSPAGLVDLGDRVAKGSNQGPVVDAGGSSTSSSSSSGSGSSSDSNASSDRVISIIGAIGLGADAARAGWAPFVFMIGLINLFLGLVNLLPILPFDGGHLAIAVYEKIRSVQTGRDYRADVAKMLPVTYAVVMIFAFIGLSAMYLDIVAPVGS